MLAPSRFLVEESLLDEDLDDDGDPSRPTEPSLESLESSAEQDPLRDRPEVYVGFTDGTLAVYSAAQPGPCVARFDRLVGSKVVAMQAVSRRHLVLLVQGAAQQEAPLQRDRLYLWDWVERRMALSGPFETEHSMLSCALYVPHNHRLWTADWHGNLCVWQLAAGLGQAVPGRAWEEVLRLHARHAVPGALNSLCLVHDSVWLGGQGFIQRRCLDGELQHAWSGASERTALTHMAYVPHTQEVWSGQIDGSICVWGATSCRLVNMPAKAQPNRITCVAVSGWHVFTADWEHRSITLWDPESHRCLQQIARHDDFVSSILVLPTASGPVFWSASVYSKGHLKCLVWRKHVLVHSVDQTMQVRAKADRRLAVLKELDDSLADLKELSHKVNALAISSASIDPALQKDLEMTVMRFQRTHLDVSSDEETEGWIDIIRTTLPAQLAGPVLSGIYSDSESDAPPELIYSSTDSDFSSDEENIQE